MKRSFWPIAAICCSSFVAQANTIPASMQQLIHKTDPNINLGMMVVDLTTGYTLYDHQSQQLFVPASNMKLFSEAFAMLAMGTDYQIPSTLSTDAKTMTQGQLNGSLYLHLSPDPSLNHRDLYALFDQLQKWHITGFSGDVVVDSDLAGVAPYAPGMTPRDQQFSYGAPIGPVILDENRLSITVNPASQAGQMAVVETTSPDGVFKIDNQVKTQANPKGCGVSMNFDNLDVLHVRGCVGVGQLALIQRIPIRQPQNFLSAHIRYQLKQMNINWQGQVRYAHMPAKTIQIARHYSPPLQQLMSATLKPSDNLYANSLYLLATNHIRHAPSNWSEAQAVAPNYLKELTHINFDNAVFTDGSGLSHFNQVTPYQTLSLLTYLYTKFPLAYEYISALPISGYDGTLVRRLNRPDQKGLVRAKTGTLVGVYSLSGYLLSKNDHILAFAIYINTRKGTPPQIAGRYRGFIDAATNILIQSQPSNFHHSLFFAHENPKGKTNLTAEDMARRQVAFWRNLEYALKRELNAKPVTVVFHPQELVIEDHGTSDAVIWQALKKLNNNRPFSVALESMEAPNIGADAFKLLWLQHQPEHGLQKKWIVRPIG